MRGTRGARVGTPSRNVVLAAVRFRNAKEGASWRRHRDTLHEALRDWKITPICSQSVSFSRGPPRAIAGVFPGPHSCSRIPFTHVVSPEFFSISLPFSSFRWIFDCFIQLHIGCRCRNLCNAGCCVCVVPDFHCVGCKLHRVEIWSARVAVRECEELGNFLGRGGVMVTYSSPRSCVYGGIPLLLPFVSFLLCYRCIFPQRRYFAVKRIFRFGGLVSWSNRGSQCLLCSQRVLLGSNYSLSSWIGAVVSAVADGAGFSRIWTECLLASI